MFWSNHEHVHYTHTGKFCGGFDLAAIQATNSSLEISIPYNLRK